MKLLAIYHEVNEEIYRPVRQGNRFKKHLCVSCHDAQPEYKFVHGTILLVLFYQVGLKYFAPTELSF